MVLLIIKRSRRYDMTEKEYNDAWINRKRAIVEMRKHFSSLNIFFRWVDTSGANWYGYDGYIAAYRYTEVTDEYGQKEYEEIGRIGSSSPYLEDGTNLVGGKGCIAMCSFRKQAVSDFIGSLSV
jgi:hypothetical protein